MMMYGTALKQCPVCLYFDSISVGVNWATYSAWFLQICSLPCAMLEGCKLQNKGSGWVFIKFCMLLDQLICYMLKSNMVV